LVSAGDEGKVREFERRSRDLLEASAANLDGLLRARLSEARVRALEELERPVAPAWLRTLAPAGGLAAAALVAVLAWRGASMSPEAGPADAGRSDVLEVVAMSDDFDLLQDDVEFYQWLDTQPDLKAAADLAGVG
jgi:hypothetical protein